jgi:hypothetical protein
MNVSVSSARFEFAGYSFAVSRPHSFGLVFEGPPENASADYLHDILLAAVNREAFLALIAAEGLIVCKQVQTNQTSYRKVRGKSSATKLSQAEYYHHDGCSTPTKPRVVEIRLPYQQIGRTVATAIARFPDVMRAMLTALPERLQQDREIADFRTAFLDSAHTLPPSETWDRIQGRITRFVRHELDAENCRAWFREVDRFAKAYMLPWEMGESRLMANATDDLANTMQHRRAYQQPRVALEQNGSLVKRWTAEEF